MSKDNNLEPVAWRTYRSKRWCFAYSPNRNLCQCAGDWQGLVTAEQAEAHCAALRQALHDLVRDLEMRSKWKEGSNHGVVDCGNGVYMKAKAELGEL